MQPWSFRLRPGVGNNKIGMNLTAPDVYFYNQSCFSDSRDQNIWGEKPDTIDEELYKL